MLSSFVESVYVDQERNCAWTYGIFNKDYVGVEGNNTSLSMPYWRSHNHGGGHMRSATRGFWLVDTIGRRVEEPLFSSAILIYFVYEMIILMPENAKTGTPGGKGGRGGMITKIICFCDHYNILLLHFITNCYLILDCFHVGIMYIPVQKIFLILTHNQKTL